jgi:hypothetical protein
MTRDEALKKLGECDEFGVRVGHVEADEVLCALLEGLGYGDVVEAWRLVDKWYA